MRQVGRLSSSMRMTVFNVLSHPAGVDTNQMRAETAPEEQRPFCEVNKGAAKEGAHAAGGRGQAAPTHLSGRHPLRPLTPRPGEARSVQ